MNILIEKLIPTGNNIKFMQEGDKLIIFVNLEETIGLSTSGKMMGIASSEGFTQLAVTTSRGKRVKMNMYIGE